MGTCNERDCKLMEMVYGCSRRGHYDLFCCFCLRLLMFSVHLKRCAMRVVPRNMSTKQIIHFSIFQYYEFFVKLLSFVEKNSKIRVILMYGGALVWNQWTTKSNN